MRRKERQMSDADAAALLLSQNWGVLSVVGDDGMPYGVPVNYGFLDGKIYIHHTNAPDSLLSSLLAQNANVCFSVVGRHEVDEPILSTHYDSVIVFGTAAVVTDEDGKTDAMMKMMTSLAPSMLPNIPSHSQTSRNYLMIVISPSSITGKRRK